MCLKNDIYNILHRNACKKRLGAIHAIHVSNRILQDLDTTTKAIEECRFSDIKPIGVSPKKYFQNMNLGEEQELKRLAVLEMRHKTSEEEKKKLDNLTGRMLQNNIDTVKDFMLEIGVNFMLAIDDKEAEQLGKNTV